MGNQRRVGNLILKSLCLVAFVGSVANAATYKKRQAFKAGKTQKNCVDSVQKNQACVFYKNPIYTKKTALSSFVGVNLYEFLYSDPKQNVEFKFTGDLTAEQSYAVSIPDQSLVNNTYRVGSINPEFIAYLMLTGTTQFSRKTDSGVTPKNGNWVYPITEAGGVEALGSALAINTYYWANRQATQAKELVGTFYGEDQQVLIDPEFFVMATPTATKDGKVAVDEEGMPVLRYEVHEKNAAWVPYDNTMIIGSTMTTEVGLSMPISADASVIAHEAGHVMMTFATNRSLDQPSTLDVSCSHGALCSKDRFGSPKAIGEGVGDIASYILFDDSRTGEVVINNTKGLDALCGMPRDPKIVKNRKITAKIMYMSCMQEVPGLEGEIHNMGAIYAAIWYGIIERAKKKGLQKKAKQLFLEHMKNLTNKDNFLTAKTVIKTIDRQVFKGVFAQDIEAEYKAVGL